MFFALFSLWHDTYDKRSYGCHANRASVITTRGEKHEICWNEPETAVTLHRQSDKTTFFDLLIQNKYKLGIKTPASPEVLTPSVSALTDQQRAKQKTI